MGELTLPHTMSLSPVRGFEKRQDHKIKVYQNICVIIENVDKASVIIGDDPFCWYRWRALILWEVLLIWNRESLSVGAFFVVDIPFTTL